MEDNYEKSVLEDIEQNVEFDQATTNQRLLNFIIDSVVRVVLLFVIQSLLFGLEIGSAPLKDDDKPFLALRNALNDLLISYLFLIVFYTLMEGLLKGKTIGKYITRTRAITEDGNPVTIKEAFLRSLCRIIPFEPFSALGDGYPWHDKFTKTYVIQEK